VLAPGLRLGWATAAPALLEKLIFHLHGSTLGPCALSQVVVASLLHHWGQQGFEQHVKDMQQGYAQRAHILHTAAGELSLSSSVQCNACLAKKLMLRVQLSLLPSYLAKCVA